MLIVAVGLEVLALSSGAVHALAGSGCCNGTMAAMLVMVVDWVVVLHEIHLALGLEKDCEQMDDHALTLMLLG